LKAAATRLFAGYYVVRMGPDCSSPYDSGYGPSPPGNEWPGGCFGDWAGAAAVAPTLRAAATTRALRPGALRLAFTSSTRRAYAALRTDTDDPARDAVIVVLNFGASATTVTLGGGQIDEFAIARSQTPVDLVTGSSGPRIRGMGQPWMVTVPAKGWAVYTVKMA